MIRFFKRAIWYIKSDIELKTTTVFGVDGIERIDGFYFYTKRPFSKKYKWHSVIGLENTYRIIKAIQMARKYNKRGLPIRVGYSLGYEEIVIWKGSLKKAESKMFDMVKRIQSQY